MQLDLLGRRLAPPPKAPRPAARPVSPPPAPAPAPAPAPRPQARFLVVGLPAFRLERCGWSASDLAALTDLVQNATRLVALTPAVRDEGLHVGMTAAEARALLPELALEPVRPAEEDEDLAALCVALTAFSDRVQALGPDAIALDVTSTARLHGGEPGIMAAVRTRLQDFGHRLHLAVCDHPQAGAALVRQQGPDRAVPPGQGAAALASLPVAALRPSEAMQHGLLAVGIRKVEDFARLDPASVTGRYGEEGARLHRLARGATALGWTAVPLREPPERIVVLVDAPLTTTQPLLAHLDRGLERMVQTLTARDEALAAVDLRLELERGAAVRVPVHVGHPTRDAGLLHALFAVRLDRLALDSPVVGLALDVREVVPGTGWQDNLFDRREATEPLPELVARLLDVLGDTAVFYAEPADTWRPEAAWTPRDPRQRAPQPACQAPPVDDPVAALDAADWNARRPRPTLLRAMPLPVRVRTDASGQPVALRTPLGERVVHRASGPELLEGDWWHADGGFHRAYWVVELELGDLIWLYEERSQWFFHGWFD